MTAIPTDAAGIVQRLWRAAWDRSTPAERAGYLRGLRTPAGPGLTLEAWDALPPGVRSRIVAANALPT